MPKSDIKSSIPLCPFKRDKNQKIAKQIGKNPIRVTKTQEKGPYSENDYKGQ